MISGFTNMENRDKKTIIKYFIIFFMITLFTTNWDDVSWVFNYEVVSGVASEMFGSDSYQASAKNGSISQYTNENDSLDIPELDVSSPLIIGETTDTKELEKLLKYGVVYYPGSVLPGEEGKTIILGHSSHPSWPKVNYNWVFTNLNELERGDEIVINFNNEKYTYRVRGTNYIKKGEKVESRYLTDTGNMLMLVSCWPPGKDAERIVVEAELIK